MVVKRKNPMVSGRENIAKTTGYFDHLRNDPEFKQFLKTVVDKRMDESRNRVRNDDVRSEQNRSRKA